MNANTALAPNVEGQMAPSYYFTGNTLVCFLQTYKTNLEWIANFHDSSIICERVKHRSTVPRLHSPSAPSVLVEA